MLGAKPPPREPLTCPEGVKLGQSLKVRKQRWRHRQGGGKQGTTPSDTECLQLGAPGFWGRLLGSSQQDAEGQSDTRQDSSRPPSTPRGSPKFGASREVSAATRLSPRLCSRPVTPHPHHLLITYYFPQQDDVLAPDDEDAPGDVPVLLAHMDALHGLVQHQVRCSDYEEK